MLSFIVKSICARLEVETPGPFERCGRPPGNFKDVFIFDVAARAEQPGQFSSLMEWQGLLRCDVWRVPDLGCGRKSCFVVMGTMKCSSGHLHQLCRQWFGVWPSSSSLFWYLAVRNHWFVLNSVIQRYPEIAKAEDAPLKFMTSNVLSSDKCLLQPKPRSFWSTWRCRSSQHFWDSERHPHGEKDKEVAGSTLSGSLSRLLLAYFYFMQASKNTGLWDDS